LHSYQGFWGLLQDGIVTYQIIDDGQLRTLIVTGVNNDYAVYRNEKLVLSLEDISKSEFLIYPTIVRTNFKINYNPDSEIQKITIYDAIGQMVSTIVNQDSEIDVSNLLSGIYFVVIQTNEGNITTKKIIKL
jgi:predicted nuclease of predicted toxin-antitoxin system